MNKTQYAYPNHMLTMEKFAERLDISTSKLYKLINSFDDSKSILKGTRKFGKNRKISSWKVDELIQQIEDAGGIESYATADR